MTRLVVVGAGIAGLTAAFEWRRRRPGDDVVVVEAGGRVGGKIDRLELAGQWYDTGPEAVLARVPEAVTLVERLGLADSLVAPTTLSASARTRATPSADRKPSSPSAEAGTPRTVPAGSG